MRIAAINDIVKHWAPVLLVMAFIFWMSTGEFSSDNTSRFILPIIHFLLPDLPESDVALTHEIIRKAGHFTEYFILSVFLFRAFRGNSGKRWSFRWAFYAIIITSLYAFSDEFHQTLVPTRTPSLMDVGIDTVGGIAAQLIIACRKLIVRIGQ